MTGNELDPVANEEDSGAGFAAAPLETTTQAEGTGETVGEAKWAALRELKRRSPELDRASVRFVVISEGERGILGVGYSPARVVAEVSETPAASAAPVTSEASGPAAARVRELLELVRAALGVEASVAVSETETGLAARFYGPDVGLLIGRRGHTIDAVQYVANVLLTRDEAGKDVVVDAAGYRGRRQVSLERAADRAAREALTSGAPVALEAMSAAERKIVHQRLQSRADVTTSSEGTEPNRHVVVTPAQ